MLLKSLNKIADILTLLKLDLHLILYLYLIFIDIIYFKM